MRSETTGIQNESGSDDRLDNSTGGLKRLTSLLGIRRISGLYVLAALVLYFSFATNSFMTRANIVSIGFEQAVTAIVAIGLVIPLAAGVFDLSIGGTMGLAAVTSAQLMHAMNPVPATLITLAVACFIGLVNGLLVTFVRIDPFIATLGMGSVLSAVVFIVSNNSNVLGVPTSFTRLASLQLWGVSLPVFYVVAVGLIAWYVLEWTPVGRRLYATGGSREVARLAGVNTTRYIILAFVCCAGLAAVGGMLVTSTLGTGSPQVGPSYLLPAFAACFLGSTQFRPGRFNIWGTVLAVYLLATGVQGLIIMGAAFWTPPLFNGLALIFAVGITSVGKQVGRRVRRPRPSLETSPQVMSGEQGSKLAEVEGEG
jgi:ribose transport system permease protein